uniref:Uncharacterized protein n=1 Tax=Davidia involucrata TaxID=16924 RepID=A0A5B7BWH0_DAVIN
MLSAGHDLPHKCLQIKEDDKFFCRLLSKESSNKAESSSRVLYYGGASGAVPFMWESQPGTPKHTFSNGTSLPPLTPPPSYQFNSKVKKSMQKGSKPKFLHTIFPRMASKKSIISSYSVSSSSSSSYSLPSTPTNPYLHRSRSTIHFGVDDDDEQAGGSPTSTLCFGFRHGVSRELRGGHHSKVNVKNALLSMIGHGTA